MKVSQVMLSGMILLNGCASYGKRIQLSPQSSIGWQQSNRNLFQSTCESGTISVGPVVLGYASKGNINLGVPIPSGNEELRRANQELSWCYIKFRSRYPIKSCDLSFVFLVARTDGNQLSPIDAMEIPSNGPYEGFYTHECHYRFALDKNDATSYSLHLSEKVLGCRMQPLLLKREDAFEFTPKEVM